MKHICSNKVWSFFLLPILYMEKTNILNDENQENPSILVVNVRKLKKRHPNESLGKKHGAAENVVASLEKIRRRQSNVQAPAAHRAERRGQCLSRRRVVMEGPPRSILVPHVLGLSE